MGKNNLNTVRNKKGSTLIWVLILMLVLGILITAGLAIAQAYSSRSITQHVQKQSYYTAYSVTKSMAEWLQGTTIETVTTDGGDPVTTTDTDKQNFISRLKSEGKLVKNVSIGNGDMGTCVTTFTMDDEGNVLISSTADYEGESSVVSVTLTNTSNTEYTEGTSPSSVEWPVSPTFTVPELKKPKQMKGNFAGGGTEVGEFEVSGNCTIVGNVKVEGYIYIPPNTSLSIESEGHDITIGSGYDIVMNVAGLFNTTHTAKVYGSVFVNGGKVVTNANSSFSEDIYIENGGDISLNSNTSVGGEVYICESGSAAINDNASIDGNIYIFAGGTLELNDFSTVNGDIFIEDGGKLIAKDNTRINGNIIVYKGSRVSTVSISNTVVFSSGSKIYFTGPLVQGDQIPILTDFKPNSTMTGLLHVQDREFLLPEINRINPGYPARIYCTNSKTTPCKHRVPNLPIEVVDPDGDGSGGTGDPGTPDTEITTETWNIGTYTGRDIAK